MLVFPIAMPPLRELANTLERAAILAEGDTIRGRELALPGPAPTPSEDGATMAAIEREAILRALDDVGGNRRRAAERLGIGVRTLYEKLKRYEIR